MRPGTATGASNTARRNGQYKQTETPRDSFLRYCGFTRDPFRLPTAEQEYGFYDQDSRQPSARVTPPPPSSIFTPRAYYIDPVYADRRDGSVFDELRAPGHVFVFGALGAGKSTLRFALESQLRRRPDGKTLAVTYEPGEELNEYKDEGYMAGEWPNPNRHPGRDVHLRLLARAMTVDLFVQIVEQFDHREELPTAEQNARLCDLIMSLDARRLQTIERVIDQLQQHDEPEPSPVWGSAGQWRKLNRTVVRVVERKLRLSTWLRELRASGHAAAGVELTGHGHWMRALETARLWGFSRFSVLVDGLDANLPPLPDPAAHMRGRLDPLLRLLPAFKDDNVSMKIFLPEELETDVVERAARYGAAEPRVIRLRWSRERLQALIEQRYRAGGARRTGWSGRVEPALSDTFDAQLIDEANGSPRRLVTLVDELIDVHVERGDYKEPITSRDLEIAVKRTNSRLGMPLHATPADFHRHTEVHAAQMATHGPSFSSVDHEANTVHSGARNPFSHEEASTATVRRRTRA